MFHPPHPEGDQIEEQIRRGNFSWLIHKTGEEKNVPLDTHKSLKFFIWKRFHYLFSSVFFFLKNILDTFH